MKQHINLFYFGASGGFLCLHLLLLTNQYNCIFKGHTQNFDDVFSKQWDISEIGERKNSETWPDNDRTLRSNFDNKIFFHCNDVENFGKFSGRKVVVYTDSSTQWQMAKSKNAYWFDTGPTTVRDLEFSNVYNVVKGDSWPACNQMANFANLPAHIKQELILKFNFAKRWDLQIGRRTPPIKSDVKTSIFNGNIVMSELVELLTNTDVDIVVKYQDLIRTNGDILFDQLGIRGDQRCKDFVEMYVALHTPDQQKFFRY